MKAKEDELQKLKDFGTYKVVRDVGQPRISSTWVCVEKDDGAVKARLVARAEAAATAVATKTGLSPDQGE